MNDARTTREIDSAGARRAQRGVAGLVAQYIHELADGHRDNGRSRTAAAVGSSGEALRVPRPEACTA
jgi:hypothetical protein